MDLKSIGKESFSRGDTGYLIAPKSQLKALMGGVCVGYCITVILFIFYAILLTYTNLSDKGMDVVVILTTILSVAVAGFDSTKQAESKGLLWGVLAGVIYALILIIISGLIDGDFSLNPDLIVTLLVSMASGGIGGIIGVNRK